MPVQFWRDIVGKRLDWVEQPRQELLQKLENNEFKNGLASHEQITICLWGPTQVGKTTLLLKILGIREEAFAAVAEVLRGGRKTGNSSTSCPIRYHISTCSKWIIGDIESELLESDAAIVRFSELRKQIAIRQKSAELSILDVYIPDHFFEVNDRSRSISVIDLPGFEAAESSEAEYVRLLAKKYLPGADLILLVVKASNLSFLRGDNLQIAELTEWHRLPDKYRLVPTYSFSSGSFRNFFEKSENRNLPSIRKHLAAEILTFQTGLIARESEIEKLIFPMEYGDSWDSYKKECGENVAEAEAIISSSLNGIRESIRQSSGRLNRLRSTAKYQIAINSISNAREQRLSEEIAARKYALEEKNKHIEELQKEHQKLIETGKSVMRASVVEKILSKASRLACSEFDLVMPSVSKSDGVAGLQDAIRKMIRESGAAWRRAEKIVVEYECIAKIPICFELSIFFEGDEFDYIGGKLRDYSLNYYFFESSFSEDRDLVRTSFNNLLSGLKDRFLLEFEVFRNDCIEYVRNDEMDFNLQVSNISNRLSALIEERITLESDLIKLNSQREYLFDQVNQIKSETNNFTLNSKANFKKQFDDNWSRLLGGDNVFYRSLYALLLLKEYKYIFEVD